MSGVPITFNLTGSVPDAFSMSFAEQGLALTVSSALYNGGVTGNQLVYEFSTPTLSMTSDGIGALNTYNDAGAGFDGHGKYEIATLSFDRVVKITSVSLIPLGTIYNTTGENTQFVMFDQDLVINPASRQAIDPTDFVNETAIYGSYIGIGAYSRYDMFRVASITVEEVDLISSADAFSVKSQNSQVTLDVLANDIDDRRISSVQSPGILGTVSVALNGLSLIYDPGLAFDYLAAGEQATETFRYTVLGWDGTSETQMVKVTVTGALNDITGTELNNLLNGTAKKDIILGLAGNDTINGMDGNDQIDGGIGNDLLHGNGGNDRVDGGDGDDYVYGDGGADTVVGGFGNDRLYGGDGNDTLDGSIGTDRLYGDAGNDVLTGSNLANTLDGGTGLDTMSGGAGADKYYVDNSNDIVIELAGGGTDTAYITTGYVLAVNVEHLIMNGQAAIDGTGNASANRLTGNSANNSLFGLAGNDRLTGGLGNDDLIGGIGRDTLTGNDGADEFLFAEFGTANYDSIVDFNGLEDSLQLSGAVFGLAVGALEQAAFGYGTAATSAGQRFVYDSATGNLYFDADGNLAGAHQLIVSLVDGTTLNYDDIFAY